MFVTKNDRCPVKIFRIYFAKRPVNLRKSGPFYLPVTCNPSCAI